MLTYEVELRIKRNGHVIVSRGPERFAHGRKHYFHCYHKLTSASLDRLMSLFDNSLAKPVIGGMAYVYTDRT